MIENPFIITEKIIPRYFCDRKEESKELVKLLKNGNNVVLISRRRIGKTGLIQFCMNEPPMKKEYITFYFDILSTANLQEFTYLLGKEIYNRLAGFGQKAVVSFFSSLKSLSGKIGYDPLSGTPVLNLQLGDITYPDITLKEIFTYLTNAGKPCVVAIDEFQQISKYPEKNIEALLRSYILQSNNCRFIFSGSERHLLEEMFLGSNRPFYQSASFIELKIIPREIYTRFIRDMFKRGKREISPELANKVYDMFEGHTFYVQRVCNSLYANTPEGSEASERILESSIDGLLNSYDTIFRMRLFRMTTRQKELLFAIAKNNGVEKPTSIEFIRQNALSSSSAVQTALRALIKEDLVTRNEEKYIIDDKFFNLWLRKNFV